MVMHIFKYVYWNYQNKLYYLAKQTLLNLYSRQCESSYLFLFCNVNLCKVRKISYNIMDSDCYIVDDDCYIVDDDDVKPNNNTNVPITALETRATTSDHSSTCCSSNLSGAHTSPRRTQGSKESTSNTISMTCQTSPYVPINTRTNNPNLVLNPYTQFFNLCSLQSHGLSLLNVPSLNNEQHYNYTMQRFRNASLFSEQDSDLSNASPQQNSSEDRLKKNGSKPKDEDIAKTLRKWVLVNKNLGSSPGIHFTLMSYNVLAQDLLVEHQYLYRNHKPRALLWENRWIKLQQEILDTNPDILCLQEVQENHLPDYFSQFLKKGYSHLYKKKTGMRTDGCAIYYKASVFKLLEHTTVEYNQHFPTLDRDNVAIVAKFVPIHNTSAEFVVATTHLLYNPRREDVRLSQTQLLLSEIDRIAYKGGRGKKYTPVIITGDFNTEPNSAVYRLLVDGVLKYDTLTNRTLRETNSTQSVAGKTLIPPILRVTDKCQHLDLLEYRSKGENLTRKQELKLIHIRHNKRDTPIENDPRDDELFSTGTLSHKLNLQSAFLHESEATTYQDNWITVDYIFYSGSFDKNSKKSKEDKLKLVSRYSIPNTKELSTKVRHIPNFAFGSDHLSLSAKFKLEY